MHAGYAGMVLFGALFAIGIRRVESQRLGYVKDPGYRFVGVSCLLGAVVGAKLGMVFYVSLGGTADLVEQMSDLKFDGKTVLGALTGGYLGGELGKKLAGVSFSTGDALAVALPVGQAFGRGGCYFAGCCYGTESGVAWAVYEQGALRHPVPLYESVLCFALAAFLFAIRKRPRPAGHLFRYYLIGYALIRFGLEFFRGEPQLELGPLSVAQVYCALVAIGFAISIRVSATRESD